MSDLPSNAVEVQQQAYVFRCSEFVQRIAQRDPQLLAAPIDQAFDAELFDQHLSDAVAEVADMPALQSALRRVRNRAMARIAWRDIAGLADLTETLHAVTAVADCCVEKALAWLEQHLYQRYGEPLDAAGNMQRLVVLGMGKQGGYELNFSSDIDLIYCYEHDGYTAANDDQKSISNREFFTRLSQQLGKALNDITADGFVFRVDTRLRPFGASGPLVASFTAMEDYYTSHGRDWERYALIKARPVAGGLEAGERLLDLLQPFVYRRYLDYSAISALREMKAMINAEVERKNLQNDIKRGQGGIREIEFIGQAFQLIRGGREPALQDREIRSVLDKLATMGHLSSDDVSELQSAYAFHRRLENRLQQYRDLQTHKIPAADEDRARLAVAMNAASWDSLNAEIERQRTTVRRHFDAVFAVEQARQQDQNAAVSGGMWSSPELALAGLERFAIGQSDSDGSQTLQQLLKGLYTSRHYQSLNTDARARLHRLLPMLAQQSQSVQHPVVAYTRQLRLLENVMQRNVYLELLCERPDAQIMLARLASASPWITDILARYPILLDELLDAEDLVDVPQRTELSERIAQQLDGIDIDDLDLQMDVLRQFQKAQLLHIAAADVLGEMPLMQVSDALTALAEAVLEQTLRLAWRQLCDRYEPPANATITEPRIAIIAYGKLGGIELNYSSDLDVVFLLADDITQADSPFYAKLVQRIMHLLQTRTTAGEVYEVDTRLRPNGRSGLLVTRLKAFANYQHESAWTWEHQALVRARAVAGDAEVSAAFGLIRQQVLSQPREAEKLRDQVTDMRQKMRDELDKSDATSFDLKHSYGGIADIEFMVQHAVLQWSGESPELTTYTDNIRILEALDSSGHRTEADCQAMSKTYLALRRRMHELALQNASATVPLEQLADARAVVQKCWKAWLSK